MVFAKRKRSPFKGPMLAVNTQGSPSSWRRAGEAGSRSQSVGRRSGEFGGIVEEEEEDEDGMEVEEVDEFSPGAEEEKEDTGTGKTMLVYH